jgi:hypothetical protein
MATITSTPTTISVVNYNPSSDWVARSTAAGVRYAENWSKYSTAADYFNFWNTGQMAGHTCPKNPGMGTEWNNSIELVTTAGHMSSGKAFRLYLGKNNHGSSGGIDNQWFNVLFNGNPNDVAGAFRKKFYVQISVWVDEFVDYYWRQSDGSAQSCKFLRIDDHTATNTGEIVVNNQYTLGFVTTYRRTPNGNPLFTRAQNTQTRTPNYCLQPAVNNATPANPSTDAQYKQKYGPMDFTMTNGTSQATLLHLQPNTPDPDAAIGGVTWNRGGITVVEIMADLDTQSCKVWAAHSGKAPRLLVNEVGTCEFGDRRMANGVGWNCFEFTNLPYTSDGANNPGSPVAWVDYSELICSDNPIAFPGGFGLP